MPTHHSTHGICLQHAVVCGIMSGRCHPNKIDQNFLPSNFCAAQYAMRSAYIALNPGHHDKSND